MNEKPIYFKQPYADEMVQAILDGRKTQTRRAIKNPEEAIAGCDVGSLFDQPEVLSSYCPFGKVGDRLWVRETTKMDDTHHPSVILSRYSADNAPVLYPPETEEPGYAGSMAHWWYSKEACPSIHMPRWASRITLEITDVRVERLQDISEEDAKAEGLIKENFTGFGDEPHLPSYPEPDVFKGCSNHGWEESPVVAFEKLWGSIYQNWNENPWVWVVEFKVIK